MMQLFFKKQFHAAIRNGTKRTTIRRWPKARVTAGGNSYAPGLGWLRIEGVEQVELSHLGEEDARSDGFDSHASMLRMLNQLYPDHLSDGKQWFRIAFTMHEPIPPRARKAKAQQPLF
jgi:hypothetical protein